MELKKIKSESNLIKFSILYKILKGEELTQNQAKYLEFWEQSVINETPGTLLPKLHSKLKFSDIESEDHQTLSESFKFTYSPDFNEFYLNELIFEISSILNEQLIQNFEQVLKFRNLSSNWSIENQNSNFIFSNLNNMKKFLLDRVEKTQWKNKIKYNEEEIQIIKDIFALGRGSTEYEKLMLKKDLESLDKFIREINNNDDRDHLLNNCKNIF